MWTLLSLIFLWEIIVEYKATFIATLLAFMVLCGGQVVLAIITWLVVYMLFILFDQIK